MKKEQGQQQNEQILTEDEQILKQFFNTFSERIPTFAFVYSCFDNNTLEKTVHHIDFKVFAGAEHI